MKAVRRLAFRFPVIPAAILVFQNAVVCTCLKGLNSHCYYSARAGSGWYEGFSGNRKGTKLPNIVKAGDSVLHERAREVDHSEMKSEKVQNIIDDMIQVMRKAPGVGLAAPQIGIPLRVCSFSLSSLLTNFVILFVTFIFYLGFMIIDSGRNKAAATTINHV